jgi:hypothetical protein
MPFKDALSRSIFQIHWKMHKSKAKIRFRTSFLYFSFFFKKKYEIKNEKAQKIGVKKMLFKD